MSQAPLSKNAAKKKALAYHRLPKPGKLEVVSSKPCSTQEDLSLAYTPGVAQPVLEIARNPKTAYDYTNKGNLVAVITDGTAILGLGNLGPLAAKPVMEGKGVLFKQFAGIDVYDIEVNAKTPQEFIKVVEAIAPTFGGINLEDIAAPHCFEIEAALKKSLDIPVFHDDQHGTAVIICAGLLNALQVQGKTLETAKIVCLGAGAAGIASLNLLVAMGAKKSNILLVDSKGVVHKGRSDLNSFKKAYARQTQLRTLADAMTGADAFIGVSGANLVSPAMVKSMAAKPVVFALANPNPEILPEKAKAARSDLIMATGRSDYPNQVNNVLGFPFIFRGALDARAKQITEAMLIAAVHALAGLARERVPAAVLKAYKLTKLKFGPDYILPKPFDPRLAQRVPQAVAKAATVKPKKATLKKGTVKKVTAKKTVTKKTAATKTTAKKAVAKKSPTPTRRR
ncbi:MAG: malic enzyme-like NAD(P)-binding protein [Gammaproteobacteria bacterium]